uniref:Calmodulin n=1 Tax=Mucochytrium quahogii TaxID=96639 RepID=A0A7S2RRB5_9STRA|mmetsp:Transcript_5284/g.8129  ORF Transcript_5284/g.8129 Transcript_5284/m.8129 type:complete len:571 (-) Transcript_5284:628-2340(-)
MKSVLRKSKSLRLGKKAVQKQGSEYNVSEVEKKLCLNPEESLRVLPLLSVVVDHLRNCGLEANNLFLKSTDSNGGDISVEVQQRAAKLLCAHARSPSQVLEEFDVYVWSLVLKRFIQEMDSPLVSPHTVDVLLGRDFSIPGSEIGIVKEALADIPQSRYLALAGLCGLLRDCSSDSTRLTHMFGAILLKGSPTKDPEKMLAEAKTMITAMRAMIISSGEIFVVDLPPPTPRRANAFISSHESAEDAQPRQARSRYVTVTYDHQAQESDELALSAGETVYVVEQVNQEWYLGTKTLVDGTVEQGIFPGSYCNLTGNEVFEDVVKPRLNRFATSGDDSFDLTVATSKTVEALYDYQPIEKIELALTAGEHYLLINTNDPDWWLGENKQGQQGLFPRTYVEILMDDSGETFARAKAQHEEANRLANSLASTLNINQPQPQGRLRVVSHDLLVNEQKPPPPPVRTVSKKQPTKEWRITKEKYQFYFRFFEKLSELDPHTGTRYVRGGDAARFLEKSGLSRRTIAHILELADMDNDQRLDRDEFIVAHHLGMCISREDMPEPATLPEYLIPKTKR